MAAEHASVDIVNALLEAGANPNCKDGGRRCPLHYAAERGEKGMCNVSDGSNGCPAGPGAVGLRVLAV